MVVERQETVLLVADRRSSQTARILERAGYKVITTFTVDHAVAICVNQEFTAVVLDQELFIEVDDWNVAQSLKLVRSGMCVILVTRGMQLKGKPPKGVDARISQERLSGLPKLISSVKSLRYGT